MILEVGSMCLHRGVYQDIRAYRAQDWKLCITSRN